MWNAGETRTLPAGVSRLSGDMGYEGSSAHSAWLVSGISGHQVDLGFDAPFRRMLSA